MSQKIPIYIPTYIGDQNFAPARVQPRILFYNGTLECEQYYLQGFPSGSKASLDTPAVTEFPYFDNYNVVTGSFPTEGSRSLLFFNERPVYGSQPTGSLYSEYWSDYVSLLYNPKTRLLNCSAIIPLADYFKMELNDIVEFRGNYYHLRAINDYSLKDGSCNLQLLGPIIPDALAPNPPETTNLVWYKALQCGTANTFFYSIAYAPNTFVVGNIIVTPPVFGVVRTCTITEVLNTEPNLPKVVFSPTYLTACP
jgi:hypothetical protein